MSGSSLPSSYTATGALESSTVYMKSYSRELVGRVTFNKIPNSTELFTQIQQQMAQRKEELEDDLGSFC